MQQTILKGFPRDNMAYFVIIGKSVDIEPIFAEISECKLARRIIIIDNGEGRDYLSVGEHIFGILNMTLMRRFEMMLPSVFDSNEKSKLVTFFEQNRDKYPENWNVIFESTDGKDYINFSRAWQWSELNPPESPPNKRYQKGRN